MADMSLIFKILARETASKEFERVGKAADDTGKKGTKFGKSMAAGFAAVGAGAVAMAKSSVEAFVEAEKSSLRLDQALKQFPQTNDRSRASFDKLNASLAKKTKFDDDATASGQAVLAQFKLTGKQIQDLTPLLQDYAAKTGRDLPAAATVLGKAMMGNAKALKEVGINLPPATDATKNLAKAQDKATVAEERLLAARDKLRLLQATLSEKEKVSAADSERLRQARNAVAEAEDRHAAALQNVTSKQAAAKTGGDQFARVTAELRKQVGGFAEAEGKTAAGRAEILRNRFGEVQEELGSRLLPALTTLANKLLTALDFFERNSKVLVPLTAGVVTLTAVIYTVTKATQAWAAATAAANVVLAATPAGRIGAVVLFLAGAFATAWVSSERFRGKARELWGELMIANDWVNRTGRSVKTWIVDKVKDADGAVRDFNKRLKNFVTPGWIKDLGNLFGKMAGGAKKVDPANWFGDGPGIGGSPGDQPRGVQAMMAALPKGTRLISGFRPGAITATGNPSYHGKGRAVDLPPSMALFNYIKSRFGAVSKELIFSPAGGRQVHNGRERTYSGVTRANHFDHVHWAMDQGGLANGIGYMPKLTSKPERVLSPQQTDSFERFLNGGGLDGRADELGRLIAAVERQTSILERMPRQYQLAARAL